jgi:phospholipid N-methyltransferase
VVELGGGTGPIIRALVVSGVEPTHLAVIDRNPVFHRLPTARFPSLRTLCGDAEELNNILAPAEAGQVGGVVSSLRRIGWPLACQRSILEQCFAAFRGGVVVGLLAPARFRSRTTGTSPTPGSRHLSEWASQ